jgi:lipase ATG15
MTWSVTKLLKLLLPFYGQYPIPLVVDQSSNSHAVALQLRHAFVASPALPQSFSTLQRPPQILFNDVLVAPDLTVGEEDYTQAAAAGFHFRTKPIHVNRAKDQESFHEARHRSIYAGESTLLDWEEHEILAPDTTDRSTVMELARITGNAYFRPGDRGWYEVDGRWNSSFPFGWDPVDNGFRGNVFVSDDNSTVVLSIKGTSLMGQGPTASRDKLNDNRLFRYGIAIH